MNTLYKDITSELNLGKINSIEVIQTLWSGYGELVRLRCDKKSIIVKHIKLPKTLEHPRGWNSDLSHKRKLHSYQVEVNWYEIFSKIIDERCRIPKGLKCFQSQNEYLIIMEDLAEVGFGSIINKPNKNHLKSSLSWLANFHAKYLNIKNDNLWNTGTYWHLETRPDELEVLKDKKLKQYASIIDEKLKSCKYQTLVHGDAKLANFCFNIDGTKCAAVDFQYVGHGCSMKDVALFMSSAVEPEDCKAMEDWVLDTYFVALKEALVYYHPKIDSTDVEQELRPMFIIAWADFHRFIKAWSPNHYKINAYSELVKKRALESLESK